MKSDSLLGRVCASAIDRGYNSPHHMGVQICFSAICHNVVYWVTAIAIASVSFKKIALVETGLEFGLGPGLNPDAEIRRRLRFEKLPHAVAQVYGSGAKNLIAATP